MRRFIPTNTGFTLVELMVIVAVIALAATVTAPSVVGMIQRQRLQGVSNQLLWDLRSARNKAIASHRLVTVAVPNNHSYTIWTDTNGDGMQDGGEVKTTDIAAQHISLVSDKSPVFAPLGTIMDSAVMTLTDARGKTATITMTMAGSIVLQ
jgi:type IV fimbrial biogenesis protein FimT